MIDGKMLFCLSMKKVILVIIMMLITLGSVYGAHPTGWINENFSYNGLKFWKDEGEKCFMEVYLINTSDKEKLNLSVVIHGKDIFDKTLWEVKKKIKISKPFDGKAKIESKLDRYDGNKFYNVDPCDAYKIVWEIKEIN